MISWVKKAYHMLPTGYSSIIIICTLSELRPNECFESLSLIQNDFHNYFNYDQGVLEHFKYPDKFIRKTKKAFITIAFDQLLEVARSCQPMTYSNLNELITKNGLNMNMSFCRKIFATHLRLTGINQETIDLLQGRAPRSIFAKYYFRPDFDKVLKNRIAKILERLYTSITD
jgi:intergrase/recombinase